MFGKLKNKLKEWASKVSEVKEEEIKEVEVIEVKAKKKITKKKPKEAKLKKEKKTKPEAIKEIEEEIEEKSDVTTEAEKKGFLKKIFSKKEESTKEEVEEAEETLSRIESEKESPKKQSFFQKITSSKKIIAEDEFDEYAEDLEMILLENNVALEVSDKILEKLKYKIVGRELSKKEIEDTISNSLKDIVEDVLLEPFNILDEIRNKEGPYVMIFCGINGVGKTTSIAKFAHMLKEKGLTSVLAAGDTFRAAAVEQLKAHGDKLNIKVIAHDYGSDPAAVGFDAVQYANKNNIDVVLIDTAGRIHTATNLLQEMSKIKRVCKPDRTIFLGESITGNDAVDQVKAFNEHIGIDGIILSKADIDEKGGTALSVGYVTQKPILFLGTGQEYGDIEPFDKKKFIEKLGL